MSIEYWGRIGYGDTYQCGPYGSREAAFGELRRENPGELIAVGKRENLDNASVVSCVDAELVTECLGCSMDDRVGDVAEDWPTSTGKQDEELAICLRTVVSQWLSRHSLYPTFFSIVDIEERLPATTDKTSTSD